MAKKPSLRSSFADALVRAGVVSETAAESAEKAKTAEAARAAREELERARDSGDPRGIASYFIRTAPKAETYAQAVARVEKALGLTLPPSYKRFLTTIGRATFLNTSPEAA